jgi:hypothetical protein
MISKAALLSKEELRVGTSLRRGRPDDLRGKVQAAPPGINNLLRFRCNSLGTHAKTSLGLIHGLRNNRIVGSARVCYYEKQQIKFDNCRVG